MKVLKEVHTVAGDKYENNIGINCNLLELIEQLEDDGTELLDNVGNSYYVSNEQYTVTVKGKEVDPKDIQITLECQDEDRPDYFYCSDTDDELTIEQIKEKQAKLDALAKLSRDKLIARVLELEAE